GRLTTLPFSGGRSNTHLSLESMRSSGFASFHWRRGEIHISDSLGGAKILWTMNLCLLFSLGS
uniref:Uncharacterized protein n=1 Tax=Oncorhynchus kisutch TaxID=8019 RepID=A0A8C7NA16_ONCKI